MPLFADGDSTQWTVAMALVSTLGAMGTALFSYLTGRDKMRFDAERVQMKADIADCQKDRTELHEEVKELKAELVERRVIAPPDPLKNGRSGNQDKVIEKLKELGHGDGPP